MASGVDKVGGSSGNVRCEIEGAAVVESEVVAGSRENLGRDDNELRDGVNSGGSISVTVTVYGRES